MASCLIWGFGSYFDPLRTYSDIDILIAHEDYSNESCQLAIKSKQGMISSLDLVHIVILSATEMQSLNWLERCVPNKLGTVKSANWERDVERIVYKIQEFRG